MQLNAAVCSENQGVRSVGASSYLLLRLVAMPQHLERKKMKALSEYVFVQGTSSHGGEIKQVLLLSVESPLCFQEESLQFLKRPLLRCSLLFFNKHIAV